MNKIQLTKTLVLTTALTGACAMAEPATYTVTYHGTWSEATHPADFPLLAHFSPVIAISHSGASTVFQQGSPASDGVEQLCETGSHELLQAEVASAETGGALAASAEPIKDLPSSVSLEITVDSEHPMLTVAAMLAPSPDWCGVAANVNLMEDGAWVDSVTINAVAWDVGTDSAESYRAFDADSEPAEAMRLSPSPYFADERAAVASVIIAKR